MRSVSVVTLVAFAPAPSSVVSKNSSTDSFSVWPRTNWMSGESSPGIAISASCTPLSNENSVGLYCTSKISDVPVLYCAVRVAFASGGMASGHLVAFLRDAVGDAALGAHAGHVRRAFVDRAEDRSDDA